MKFVERLAFINDK